MGQFFISYKREDEDFVNLLDDRINEAGLSVFRDRQIKPGEEWKKAIDNAIESCIALIVVISPKAVESPYVTYEWSYAMGKEKTIIPLILERPTDKKIHPKILDQQWLDFTDVPRREWFHLIERLMELATENPVFPPAIQNSLNNLESSDSGIRYEAINSLLSYSDDRALDALRLACKHSYSDVRYEAALALAKRTDYQDFAAIEPLKEAVQYSGANEYAVTLGKMSVPETTDFLLRFLNVDGKHSVAVNGLAVSNDPELNDKLYERYDNLIATLEGSYNRELDYLTKIFERRQDTEAISRLINLINNDSHIGHSFSSAWIIANLGSFDLVESFLLDQLQMPVMEDVNSRQSQAVGILRQYASSTQALKAIEYFANALRDCNIVSHAQKKNILKQVDEALKAISGRHITQPVNDD